MLYVVNVVKGFNEGRVGHNGPWKLKEETEQQQMDGLSSWENVEGKCF